MDNFDHFELIDRVHIPANARVNKLEYAREWCETHIAMVPYKYNEPIFNADTIEVSRVGKLGFKFSAVMYYIDTQVDKDGGTWIFLKKGRKFLELKHIYSMINMVQSMQHMCNYKNLEPSDMPLDLQKRLRK